MKTAKHILQEEIDLLIEDIIEVYEASGKKVTGEFAEGLEAKHKDDNSVELWGYGYLAGRPKGFISTEMVENIKEWIEARGIQPIEKNMTTTSLAWAITKKIGREGTNDESHLPIYEEVLTPQRIDSIIEKVSEFHAAQFVEEVTLRIMAISQKYNQKFK